MYHIQNYIMKYPPISILPLLVYVLKFTPTWPKAPL